MSKIITFSRTFPAYHPKKGQQTYFVEKFYNSIYEEEGDWISALGTLQNYVVELDHTVRQLKHHTIRSGHRWKAGDYFSPRVWSGRPYNSPMITIAPDTKIEKVWDFMIDPLESGELYINCALANHRLKEIAKNDGLELQDLLEWFKYPKPFDGQIISWNKNINY